jgi:hypothetical protein
MAHQMSALLSISKLRAASAPAVLQFDRGLLDDYPPLDWFETVPDTLLIDIFGFVYHLLDLHRCAIVCRRWNSVVRWEESKRFPNPAFRRPNIVKRPQMSRTGHQNLI